MSGLRRSASHALVVFVVLALRLSANRKCKVEIAVQEETCKSPELALG
jgi:hypothetical protein